MESSTTQHRALADVHPGARPRDGERTKLGRRNWGIFIVALLLSDVIMAGLALRIAYLLRFDLALPIFRLEAEPSFLFYQRLAILMTPVWLVVFALNGLYQEENLLGGPKEYSLIFRSTTIGVMVALIVEFLGPELTIARGWVLLSWILIITLASTGRFGLRRVVYYLRRRGYFLSPALIVGANDEGKSVAEQLLTWETSGLRVVGFVDQEAPPNSPVIGSVTVLGDLKQLEEIVDTFGIRELILATSSLSREQMLNIFEAFGFLKDVNLRMSSGLFEIITTGLNVKEFAYVPLVGVNRLRLTGTDRILKALLDYSLTLVALLILAPVLLTIVIAIKLDSPGPVIFRRRVMGINGSTFNAFKFRTMFSDGDEILRGFPNLEKTLAEDHKLKSDPRVTSVGSFLRRTSLDELPQLINVLRREMSLVGPRMISPDEMAKYQTWGLNLLTVQPGITGLWQVSGRSDVSYDERVRLDMHYIRNWTIWLDFQLLWQTLPAVIKGTGAY